MKVAEHRINGNLGWNKFLAQARRIIKVSQGTSVPRTSCITAGMEQRVRCAGKAVPAQVEGEGRRKVGRGHSRTGDSDGGQSWR